MAESYNGRDSIERSHVILHPSTSHRNQCIQCMGKVELSTILSSKMLEPSPLLSSKMLKHFLLQEMSNGFRIGFETVQSSFDQQLRT